MLVAMPRYTFLPLLLSVFLAAPSSAEQPPPVAEPAATTSGETATDTREKIAGNPKDSAEPSSSAPRAVKVNLKEVVRSPGTGPDIFPELPANEFVVPEEPAETLIENPEPALPLLSAESLGSEPNTSRQILGVEIPPATSTRLMWEPSRSFSGMAVDTPVLVVNGAHAGPTLCLTAAIHGDELNGIEMVRRVMYDLDPDKLRGTVIGVPIVNLLGFSRNSRYLPDRRDLNRYFPGNAHGSVASRLANTFFKDIIRHCSELVDLHTGSFYRTNIPQLRADMSNPLVADFVELFGDIPVLNTSGNDRSLRAAAVAAGIPTVTLEAGEPMRMQTEMVEVGVNAIKTLMAKNGMYSKLSIWSQPEPAFYRSAWVRANASGILFSEIELGAEVAKGDLLGAINNPITNEQKDIVSPHKGRVLGMALDQFVMPGFAVYHIGIHAPKGEATGQPDIRSDAPLENGESENILQIPEDEGLDD